MEVGTFCTQPFTLSLSDNGGYQQKQLVKDMFNVIARS